MTELQVVIDDCYEVKADSEIPVEEENVPTTSGQFPDSKQAASRGGGRGDTTVTGQTAIASLLLEGTKILSVIPPKVKIHSEKKSPDNFANCSPSSAASMEDHKEPSLQHAAGPVATDSTLVGDDQLTESQETKSSDSFAVLGDENGGGGNVEEDTEVTTSGGIANGGSNTSTPRKKKAGMSALTYALQMEATKKAMEQEAAEAALKNGAINVASEQPLKKTHPRPEDLPWIPVRKWGPDGQPITRKVDEDSEFRADELVTHMVWQVDGEGGGLFFEIPAPPDDSPNSETPILPNIGEGPNMWQRFCMWCGRLLCCRDYEQL